MSNTIVNIAEGAQFINEMDLNTGLVTQRGTKIGTVSGFSGETTKEEAAAYAMSVVMAVNPLGMPYSSKFPLCRCFNATVDGQSSDVVRIALRFSTPDQSGGGSGGGGGNPWTIASTGRSVTESSEFSIDGKALILNWVNPDNKDDKIKRQGKMTFDTTWRGYTCTATLPLSKIEELEDSSDLVNKDFWSGREPGHWRIMDVNSTRPIGSKYATVSVTVLSRRPAIKGKGALSTDVGRDWSEYLILENSSTNRPIILDQKIVKKLIAMPYDINQVVSNGVMKVGPYMMADFKSIFGVSDIRRV